MAKKQNTDEPEGGIEVVPLWQWDPTRVLSPYGNQYVSGPLDDKHSLTFPGVPIRVKSTRFVQDELLPNRLAVLPEDMTLGKLAPAYQREFDNPKRWAGSSGTEDS